MKSGRFTIVLAILLATIVAVTIYSYKRSYVSDVYAPVTYRGEEKRKVFALSQSNIEVDSPALVNSDSEFRPASSWKFAGSTTPKAAFESLFWAKEHLESTVLVSLISISPEVRGHADQVLYSMTPTARSRLALHTPEALIAYLYATSPVIRALRIRAEQDKGLQYSTVSGKLQLENGRKAAIELGFRLEGGGWRYVLDERNARDMLDGWQRVWKNHEK